MVKNQPSAYEYSLQIAEQTLGDGGRQKAISAFEAWERRCLQIRSGQHAIGGGAAVGILIASVAMIADDGIALQLTRYLLAGFVALLGIAVALWDLIRLFPANWITRAVLFDAAMTPFHDLRLNLNSGKEIAERQDGSRVSAPLFGSPVSLTAFSRDERIRTIRLPGSTSGLEYEPLIQCNPSEKEITGGHAKLALDVERLTEKIDDLSKSVRARSERKPANRSAKPHWYASVSKEIHDERSPEIAARWDGYHEQQVQLAMDTAFAQTRADKSPFITPGELKNVIAKALKEAHLPIGLGERDSESDVWIGQMFGRGNGHAYVYVRRYLTEPDFSLQKELPLER